MNDGDEVANDTGRIDAAGGLLSLVPVSIESTDTLDNFDPDRG